MDRSTPATSRRDFLRIATGSVAAASFASLLPSDSAQAGPGQQAQGFRFVHLTDIHLRTDRRSPQGLAACLDSLSKLDPKPAFIVTGGDQCDNLRALDLPAATARLDLFLKIWRDHTDLPTHHSIGNHDLAGWANKEFPRSHPGYGKKLMMDRFGMKDAHYAIDHDGWRIIVLDNIKAIEPGKFLGEFDKAELDFLQGELRQHRQQPTMVICHVPPISAEEFLGGKIKATDGGWEIPYGRVCKNPAALVDVLGQGNVKLVLSGHIHHLERIETHGQTFICGGAVSGNWWQGPLRGCGEGYGVVDCRPDGTWSYHYQDFGWKAG